MDQARFGVLGPMEIETTVGREWRAKGEELGARLLTDEWLYRKSAERPSLTLDGERKR